MSFWDKMQKDISKNIQDGIAAIKEGGSSVSKKIEWMTEEGKRKYRIYSLHVNVKEEFEKLGGQIYDLTSKKVKSPLSSRKVTAIITRIRKLEKQITRLEQRASKASAKKLTRTSKRRTKTA